MSSPLLSTVGRLRDLLEQCNQRIVFAESCTAGRVVSAMSVLPGISQWLCGGFVVYRSDSKNKWLSVPQAVLDDPQLGPVSEEATRLLCQAALDATPEAHWAVAVTGDIGPGAPKATDGTVFVAICSRDELPEICQTQFQLKSPSPIGADDVNARVARLDEATQRVLTWTVQQIELVHRRP